MRTVIRYFFRFVRLILTPIMLISEKLTTPTAITRSADEQARVDLATSRLALYQFRACPFCIKVRKEIARLGLSIETRDARLNAQHRDALQTDGGRVKVPCLRIQHENGSEEWLYESDAIKSWLQQHFDTV
ncbi:glutaredoxin family protein [Nitrincola sp. MINF-07-Sa-05]|uniref:glutaredoxin family protein n=1 Tax=Nitrincola salilacus TaxID=3400273 RepID=UPI003917EBB0